MVKGERKRKERKLLVDLNLLDFDLNAPPPNIQIQ